MKILDKALIQTSEENAVQNGFFSFRELMFRAGNAAAELLMQKIDVRGKAITVVCGKGNNGGDGCVIAECLAEHGARVTAVFPLGAPQTEQARYYYDRLRLTKITENTPFDQQDILIDALFGIGLDRDLQGIAADVVQTINDCPAFTVAVDVPSGIESDSGRILGCAVKADLTVTFIALKPCFVLPQGSDYCGEVLVADIGVTPAGYRFLTTERPVFEKRPHNSHKGSFGTALLFCGSYGMAGAAVLAARAALRSGVGVVKAVVCDRIYPAFTAVVPEAVCLPVPTTQRGTLSEQDIDLAEAAQNAKAILVGCGCRNDSSIQSLVKKLIAAATVPLVIDADGINALAPCIDIIRTCKAPVVLTPHPGEMARLLNCTVAEVEADRVNTARAFARRYGCTLVLKGANTIIATDDGEIFFNTTGNPGMAKGGSGDLLSGILVSLLAQGFPVAEAAKAAVYLHGEAGDKACAKYGERAMLPSDMIKEL